MENEEATHTDADVFLFMHKTNALDIERFDEKDIVPNLVNNGEDDPHLACMIVMNGWIEGSFTFPCWSHNTKHEIAAEWMTLWMNGWIEGSFTFPCHIDLAQETMAITHSSGVHTHKSKTSGAFKDAQSEIKTGNEDNAEND